MGYYSKMIFNFTYPVIFVLLLFSQQSESCRTKEVTMAKQQVQDDPSQQAHDYIAAFRRGEDFRSPSRGIISGGKPDSLAVWILGHEMSTADPSVREKIVALLVDVGVSADPLQPEGAEVLRNLQIIEILAGAGLVKPDLGREAAMDALRKLVTQPDLARYGDSFNMAIEHAPSEEAFLLIAKAKPARARMIVDQLAISPDWNDVEEAKIARAALGATDIENEFLARADSAEAARDGRAFSEALVPLALMGTSRSLKAIAERLRTPLIFEVPGAYKKSVRLNVLEALLYNFPDQPVLYPNNIITEADYTAAELFCIRTLGVTYTTPPPPFMTYYGYPTPSRK
jgi:hypothetical protein